MRPLIGISCCVKGFGMFNTPNHAASDSYVKVVLGPVGGLPVLLPCFGPDCVAEILARVDGLIFTGSRSNVWPEYYGGPPHAEGTPEDLRREAREGLELTKALDQRLGGGVVRRTDLGPLIPAEDVLALATAQAGLNRPPIVPVEATAALGMILMERRGILTTNIAGQPGAHPALRLKPAGPALERCGGAQAVAHAVDDGLAALAGLLATPGHIPALLLG